MTNWRIFQSSNKKDQDKLDALALRIKKIKEQHKLLDECNNELNELANKIRNANNDFDTIHSTLTKENVSQLKIDLLNKINEIEALIEQKKEVLNKKKNIINDM